MNPLSKDSEKAFKIIYCEYKRRRKSGFTKEDSLSFSSGEIESLEQLSDWLKPDITSAINELKCCSFIKVNIIGDSFITPAGIKYMEEKPKAFFNELSNLFDLASIFV